MRRSAIKVKAMGFFVADGRLLASPSFDSTNRKPHYRLLGGHVEFGERSEETLAREILEELGAKIEVQELLEVVQNRFVYAARERHEIVFIHRARFLDPAFTRREILPNIEPGRNEVAKWLPVDDALNGRVPLFPATDYRRFLSAAAG